MHGRARHALGTAHAGRGTAPNFPAQLPYGAELAAAATEHCAPSRSLDTHRLPACPPALLPACPWAPPAACLQICSYAGNILGCALMLAIFCNSGLLPQLTRGAEALALVKTAAPFKEVGAAARWACRACCGVPKWADGLHP